MKLFTAKEIAEALKIAKRNVSLRAKNEGWPFQLLAGLGGRVPHYLFEGLPEEVANAVEKKFHPSSLASKAKNKKTVESTISEVEKLHEKIIDYFGEYGGYAQQFLFKNERESYEKKWLG